MMLTGKNLQGRGRRNGISVGTGGNGGGSGGDSRTENKDDSDTVAGGCPSLHRWKIKCSSQLCTGSLGTYTCEQVCFRRQPESL
eukprot:15109050-Ditylum_brightwellii.AAC.1